MDLEQIIAFILVPFIIGGLLALRAADRAAENIAEGVRD